MILLRALTTVLGYIPTPTLVFAPGAHFGDVHQHLQVAEDDDCECGGCDADPDEPEQMLHQMPSGGLWQLMYRAGHHSAHNARQGADDNEAAEHGADVVMAELMLEHAEVTVEEDDA